MYTVQIRLTGDFTGLPRWVDVYQHETHAAAICLAAECRRHGDVSRIVDETTRTVVETAS